MHWLLIVNASTNFLIYCFMGNKFKTVLMSMVRNLIKGKEQPGSLVMMADAAGVKRDISKVNVLHNDDDDDDDDNEDDDDDDDDDLTGNNVDSCGFTNSSSGTRRGEPDSAACYH